MLQHQNADEGEGRGQTATATGHAAKVPLTIGCRLSEHLLRAGELGLPNVLHLQSVCVCSARGAGVTLARATGRHAGAFPKSNFGPRTAIWVQMRTGTRSSRSMETISSASSGSSEGCTSTSPEAVGMTMAAIWFTGESLPHLLPNVRRHSVEKCVCVLCVCTSVCPLFE